MLYSREGTVEWVVAKIDELAARGRYFSAVTVPPPATHALGEAARRGGTVVSIGENERDSGSLFNRQLLFDALVDVATIQV